MSIFNELLPKINEISNVFTNKFNDELKVAFEFLDKFEEEYKNGRGKTREKLPKEKIAMTSLQSINEDEDEPIKNKGEDHSSPEQQRQKRNASAKAQSIISKQVNVNLTQKLRRENSTEKSDKSNATDKTDKTRTSRNQRRKEAEKENAEPILNIQIKQEKISLPPEPMDLEPMPDVEVKQEMDKDEIAMPPPVVPVPRSRKAIPAKDKSKQEDSDDEGGRKRNPRTKKQTEVMPPPPPPVASKRSTRASSRATRQAEAEECGPAEPRPKRTRAKRKVSEITNTDNEKEALSTQENGTASPAKPRPKRTRRAQKATEKETEEPLETPNPEPVSAKEQRLSRTETDSPILRQKDKKQNITKEKIKIDNQDVTSDDVDSVRKNGLMFDETRVIESKKFNSTTLNELDKTVVLPNGVYNHAPMTPKNITNMNETIVLEKCNRETLVLDKQIIMDATVVIDKDPKATNVTDDNSILTDDSDEQDVHTPPKQHIPAHQPTSAVKEKVQQFEELASRVTRTKTRAMAKKDEQPENQTPPDKIVKPVLSSETLQKMNSMIFNGKPPQISSSATKPRTNMVTSVKSSIPASTSKLSAINKAKEAAEESLKREKEDARKKKEAMLEAKRELQKKKREDKMAAAAAAREAAEKDRRLAMEAAAKERMEKQAHATLGKLERLKEAERKKHELARKVAETEERRRAEEIARQQRLAEEQRRAEVVRRKQLEEAEAMKKEAATMAKEIEKRQKEYIEKQKMKHKSEDKSHTPLGHKGGTPSSGSRAIEPVYMADGFQYLNSDEDEEPVERPAPTWSTSKARKQHLHIQCQIAQIHIDRLFSVRIHSPDLRDIFPDIERTRLKRTSSAVWRTPPSRLPALHE